MEARRRKDGGLGGMKSAENGDGRYTTQSK